MRVFISADIEGVTGIAHWNETDIEKPSEFAPFAKRMTLEVAAVCEGINDFDAQSDILVKDAHGPGRNIDHELLPENVSLNRAFSGHPHSMMNLIDQGFDASMLTGYHSPGYNNGNPMAHTMSGAYGRVLINGIIASEFLINYYTSLYYNVPMVLVSGDARLMELVKETDPDIITVETLRGFGASVTSMHPGKTRRLLRENARQAMENAGRLKALCSAKLPDVFNAEVRFREHHRANAASNYPGAVSKDAHTIAFTCKDYFDFLRFFQFI
ncbi:MAG: M55 family metallopeptidase [Defluviitaleaceae bacterium]|nr:M55 family metallopeptidase [Defluviitaleaceae bacterium]MCL2835886.1 M55 family metallopeptidase [Defluviitaleaceae bacterium]